MCESPGVARARKFFVTGVKDLSTGVKYMDSKVVFGFIRTGGGARGGKMCRSTMRRSGAKGGAKCVEVLCVEGGGGAKCVEVVCVEIFTN